MKTYIGATLLDLGLIGLAHVRHGRQLWHSAIARKLVKCQICRAPQTKGATVYRPVTNGKNRMERICTRCVLRLVAERKRQLTRDAARRLSLDRKHTRPGPMPRML